MKTNNYLFKTIMLFSFAVLFFGAAASVRADVSSCGDFAGIEMRRVTYYENSSPVPSDLRASFVNDRLIVRLRGWLYYPSGKKLKNKKVIIFNHGHADARPEPCGLARYFVREGYVFFAPLRRGHYASEPDNPPSGWQSITSTGIFTDDYANNCVLTGNCSCNTCSAPAPTTCNYNRYEVNYIYRQVEDVREQTRFIRNHDAIDSDGSPLTGKLADAAHIAILGHSYGGSLITFANAQLELQNVAISVSGAELSWGSDEPAWETELSCAMESQNRPIYFLQPKNGLTLAPMKKLFGIAVDKKYRSQAAIFPATAWDQDAEDPEAKQAHENFIGDAVEIQRWGPTVKEFIGRYPREVLNPN